MSSFLLFICSSLVLSSLATVINVTAPTYYIDTSLPASEYLKQPCAEMKDHTVQSFTIMIDLIPSKLQPTFYILGMEYWLSGSIGEPYKSEIQYLSECTGLSIDQLITANLVYEFLMICTSMIAIDKNGKIIHGRNQDFPITLRNDTVNMIYVDSSNQTLYYATTFFGYVGVPTGLKPNRFSITMDGRAIVEKPWENIMDVIADYFPSGWLLRECLIKDNTFDECVYRLSNTLIMSPIYYIIAGTINGAVITRNQTNINGPTIPAQPWYLNNSEYGWYLLETNYDYWVEAKDLRRYDAHKMLESVGQQNIDYYTMFNILSTPPVLVEETGNQEQTVYTTIMSPNVNLYTLTIV